MPVSLTWDTQDAVPDALKEHAVEKDGKFVFEAETLKEVENLKKTTKSERDARTRYEKELKGVERFKSVHELLKDADDEELTQFLEAYSKRGETNGDNKDKPDPEKHKALELEKKLTDKELKKLRTELDQLKPEHEKLKTRLRDFELWTPLREAAIKSGLIAEDWELARLDLNSKSQFGFDEEGKIVVLENGEPSTVTPEKFFKEVYPDQRPKFYKPTGAGGSGAQGGTNNKTAKTIKRSEWDQLGEADRNAKIADKYVIVD